MLVRKKARNGRAVAPLPPAITAAMDDDPRTDIRSKSSIREEKCIILVELVELVLDVISDNKKEFIIQK